MNAIKLLKDDHGKVTELFDEFDLTETKSIADKICQELDIHAKIEEQIFYPAAKKADEEMVDHGLEEHQEMKILIAELRAMGTVDEDFKLTVEELRAVVEDHVEEEEGELFPETEAKLGEERLIKLGQEMMKLKEKLQEDSASKTKSASA